MFHQGDSQLPCYESHSHIEMHFYIQFEKPTGIENSHFRNITGAWQPLQG